MAINQEEITKVKPRQVRTKARKFDRASALELYRKGVPQRTIAQLTGVDKSTVCRGLKELEKKLLTPEEVRTYNDTETRVLTTIKSKYSMNLLQPKKIKEASALQSSLIVCQTFDKLRLLEGKSSLNIDMLAENIDRVKLSQEIEDTRKRLESLKASTNNIQNSPDPCMSQDDTTQLIDK